MNRFAPATHSSRPFPAPIAAIPVRWSRPRPHSGPAHAFRRRLCLLDVESSTGRDRRGFEPVSAETQPVSGGLRTQISDIENSASRDTLRDSGPSVREARNSSPETRLLAANLRKYRPFAKRGDSSARDHSGWLPFEDSNPSVSIRWFPPTESQAPSSQRIIP
jgi:hypothetical protein